MCALPKVAESDTRFRSIIETAYKIVHGFHDLYHACLNSLFQQMTKAQTTYSHKFYMWIKLSCSFFQYSVKVFGEVTPDH